MSIALIIIFVVAYAAIALDHPLRVNKSASALIGAGLLWTIYAMLGGDHHLVSENLKESVAATAQIVFFLMGAMTIVEVIDAHNGFSVITSLLWLVGFVSFFLSAILDNLTTTIAMISLMKKLLDRHDDRLFFAGIIVIAANAGSAWTPIGDVTTTMLWIGGQITTLNIMQGVFLPSITCLIVPLTLMTFVLRGQEVISPKVHENGNDALTTPFEQNLMFCLGIGTLGPYRSSKG
jgi:Na+/H+ antiporter NhaD/arsenite permease-like protein